MIVCGQNNAIFNRYVKSRQLERLPMDILETYEMVSKKQHPKEKRYLRMEVCAETLDGIDILMPTIKY